MKQKYSKILSEYEAYEQFIVGKLDEKEFLEKNMILLGKGYILKANMFQKNFRYNHLYNIPSDVLEKIIFEKKTKTAFSFQKVRETFHTIINKPIDLLIIIDSFLNNLNLEIKEYINAGTTLSLETILMDGLLDLGLETYTSGKGKKIILTIKYNCKNKNCLSAQFIF